MATEMSKCSISCYVYVVIRPRIKTTTIKTTNILKGDTGGIAGLVDSGEGFP